jgi:nucleoside-diphosphate-sugar epimerase
VTPGTVVVAGAAGVVGQAAVAAFAAAGWQVVAVSRRAPDLPDDARWRHCPLDLLDAEACRRAADEMGAVTHVVYAALHELPGLIEGWRSEQQMAANLAMLQNLLAPLAARGTLAHVSLLQGTKAYGVHIRPFAVPARESAPRHPHRNFYWLQEDFLRGEIASRGVALTIFRPQVIFGDATGAAMNLIPVLAAYGALCRELALPFGYPGGPDYLMEAVDARLLARALVWAATAPTAANETFNITNGDVFCWRNVWPAIAAALGLAPGPDQPRRLADWLPAQETAWQRIVAAHGLRPATLTSLLGQSHHYADFVMATGATRTPQPVLVSTIKIRRAGFADCIDTEQMLGELFAALRAKRIMPSALLQGDRI